MTKETMTGPVNGEVGRVYDKFMRVATLTVNGAATNYSFNNDGLLIGAGDITLSRDPQTGFLTGTALAAITDAYTYSTFGETSNYTAKVGGADLFNVQYTRDAIGRITTKSETIGGITTVYEYGYDLAGRLVSVKENGVTVSTYDYDANGNRITAVTKAGTFQGFYDLQDRMTKYGDADYTYTANGELTSKTDSSGVTSYNYDVYGNLRSATLPDGTQIDYVIDASNRRIGKKINGALTQGFIYKDQLEPVAELDGAGNVVTRFVYASKGHVPDYMIKGGITYRVISDHLGSVRLVINTSDNTITQRIDYDEFGNVLQDTNPGFQPFTFAGGIYDQHTKLIRFGVRDYDAFTGRWISKDMILFGDGLNVYLYVNVDPINYIDLLGLTKEDADQAFEFAKSKGEEVGLSFPDKYTWKPLPDDTAGEGRGDNAPSGRPKGIDINSNRFGGVLSCQDLKYLLSVMFHEAVHYSKSKYHQEGEDPYCDWITKSGRRNASRYINEFMRKYSKKCKRDDMIPPCGCSGE